MTVNPSKAQRKVQAIKYAVTIMLQPSQKGCSDRQILCPKQLKGLKQPQEALSQGEPSSIKIQPMPSQYET